MWDLAVDNLALHAVGTESVAWVVKETNSKKWIAKVFGLGEGLNKVKDEVNLYQFLNDHGIHAPLLKEDPARKKLNFVSFKGHQFPRDVDAL